MQGTDEQAARRREADEALTAVEEATAEARRVLDAEELHHMAGDRAELSARVKRFCDLSERYEEAV